MAEKSPKETRNDGAGHETRDINARAVAWFGIGLVITFSVIFFSVHGLLSQFSKQHRKSVGPINLSAAPELPPEPRLQSNPASELARFQAQEFAILNSYGWVDRRAGIARIPIERAMELVALRGLPASPASSGKTPLQMRQEKAKAENPPP